MLSMKIEHALTAIVEAMLPRFSSPDIALRIILDLSDDDYDTNKHTRSTIIFLIHRPSNYTKVLVQYNFNNGIKRLDTNTECYFKKYSDHDSCWKTDGFVVLSEHWHNVERHFEKHPKDIYNFYNFSVFVPIKIVKLKKLEPVKDKKYSSDIIGYNIITCDKEEEVKKDE
jgi:ribosomal protein S15P/S13E